MAQNTTNTGTQNNNNNNNSDTQMTDNATNNTNTNTTNNTQRSVKFKLHTVKAIDLVDPSFPLENVMRLANVSIAAGALPSTEQALKKDHYSPFPIGMRYLMSNSAIENVTQIDASEIKNPNWKQLKQQPLLKHPLPPCPYLNILLRHPRDPEFNRWQTQLIPACEIRSTHILRALRLLQLSYFLWIIHRKNSTEATTARNTLIMQFRRLPEPVQQWVLQTARCSANKSITR